MVDAGSIWIRLGLDPSELRFGLDKAKYAPIAAEAAPVVAIGAAIYDATTKAGAFGKAVKDNARDLGLTTDEYQQWAHVTTVAGGNSQAFTESVRMMTVRMKEAIDPASDIGKRFADLGVQVTDSNGNLRSTNDVLLDTFDAINKLPEGFARNQAMQEVFGKGFSNIADLASMSRQEIQALIDQAPIIDSDKIQAMDEFNTKLAVLNEQWQTTYAVLGTELIPVADQILPLIQDYGIPAVSGLASVLEWAGRGFHLIGSEAKAAYQFMTLDFEGALQTQKDLVSWFQSEQTEDANKASGYTYGATWDGTKWVKPTKSGGAAPVADASKAAQDAEKERTNAMTDAWKEYQQAIKDVEDETKKLEDINKDFIRGFSTTDPRDIQSRINMIVRHNWEVEDQQVKINTAAASASGEKYGDVVINIDGKTLTRVQGVAAGTGTRRSLTQAGYPS